MGATATLPADRSPARPAQSPPTAADRWRDLAAVAVPAVLALGLALYGVTARSLGFDEAASATIAAQHGHDLWRAIAHDGGNMSGYYLLLHVIVGLFGHGLLAIRLPSVIAGAATVAIVGVLGLRLFSRRVAWSAGVLGAVSLPLIFWSQSARGYAPMVALAAGSCLSLVGVLERRPRSRAAYVVCTTLAVYASLVALLIVAAQLVALLWRRRDAPRLLPALSACVLGCAPLAVLAAARGSGQLFWVPRPGLSSEKQVLEALASGGLAPSFHPGAITAVLTILAGALLLASAAPIPVAAPRPRPRPRRTTEARAAFGHILIAAWLVVPVAFAWVESLVGQPIFLPRNLLLCVPAVALLLAVALNHPRAPRFAGWALLAVLIALRAVPLAQSYGTSPEKWKAASAYVLAGARPGDCVAFYPADARMPFAYYAGSRAAPRPVLPSAPWGPLRPYIEDYATLAPAEIARLPAACPRLWLVSSHEGSPSGPAGSKRHYARYVALRDHLVRAYPHHRTVRFGYAAVVTVALLSRP